jgi:hypothetical protein
LKIRVFPPGHSFESDENASVPSIPRASRRGTSRIRVSAARIRVAALASLLAIGLLGLIAAHATADPGNGNACPPSSHNPGGEPPCGFPPESEPPPVTPPPEQPPESPPPDKEPTAVVSQPPAPSSGLGGVAGARASGQSGGGGSRHTAAPGVVIVKPQTQPATHHHRAKPAKKPKAAALAPAPPTPMSAPAASTSNPDRSTFADRLLSPSEIDLSAENLGEGGLIALLLAALLYLPVTIFNKATEKNHETLKRWFERPRAWIAAAFGWLPVAGHPAMTLGLGVVASAILFSFIEPGFPTESGAPEYLLGMVLGFALVSTVFFSTWRLVLHRLEPEGKGKWELYPPFILLAGFLVIMARLAHFIPGVILGTVAEYEPAKRLSTRTAGIRVATTYTVLMALGLAAWFAWIPVEHSASHQGASSLILILDSALAITFVSSLESVAFGLLPMRFLDGNDLFRWSRAIWAGLWGAAVLWFSVVILHPAMSTYGHEISSGREVWFALLFSSLMVIAVSTWGFLRVRDARLARAGEKTAG